jgi:predicted SnoaL-like aldol condensation-catalyzing enzyme
MNKSMFRTILFITFAVVLAGCCCTSVSSSERANTNSELKLTNKDKAIAVIESFETADASVLEKYISADTFIQHNLDGKDGRQVMIDDYKNGLKAPVDIRRAFADGDYVVQHVKYGMADGSEGFLVVFEVFRFENGLIVEHWDNIQYYKKEEPNPSGHTMLDGPTEVSDIEKTEENKKLVSNLLNKVFIRGDSASMASYFDGNKYIQHNPNIGDGVSALTGGGLKGIKYLKIHNILGSGNFVLAMSEGTLNGTPTAFYDLFRVENGYIAEHWDVIQEIPPKEKWANTNGKF